MKPSAFFAALSLAAALVPSGLGPAQANPSMCGDPPPSIPVLQHEDERVNGEIDGQAKVLESLIGKTEFKGKADAYRNRLYNDPDKLRAALKEQRLFYAFCRVIEDSRDLTTRQKLDALEKLQEPLPVPDRGTPPPAAPDRPIVAGVIRTYRSFDIAMDGHAEIDDDQVLINIAGLSISPGRTGQGANVVINGEHVMMYPGEQKAIRTDAGSCVLQLVGVDATATSTFRTDCPTAHGERRP